MLLVLILFFIPLLLLAVLAWFGSNYLLARRPADEADSPANYGLAFETAEFRAGDGLLLRGWYIAAETSTKTVIICSGANGSMDSDVTIAPWLHAAGFNVLLFDWRAHGQSEGDVVTLGFNERYDLIAAVQYVKSKGAERVGGLGFSLGGTVALATAAVYEDISAVVADSPFVSLVSAVAGGLIERHMPEALAYLLARLFIATACLRTRLNLFDIDLVRWVQRIAPRPLLLIFGAQDVIAPKPEVDLIFAQAGIPKEIWRVPEAAHRNISTLRPEEYRQRISEFFREQL